MAELIQKLQTVSDEYWKLQKEADRLREERDEMIREAVLTKGVSIEEILTATGLSRERLYQIRRRQDGLPTLSGRDALEAKARRAPKQLPWDR